MAQNLQELNITQDELNRFREALKNKEFRDLLVEYCEELSDPATQKQYEEEITQLEKERGIEVTFIHPTPVYVIKTSVDGNKLAFINVCSNEHVDKPSSKFTRQMQVEGRQWALPHMMSPCRDDLSKRGRKCIVCDVIFHPETIRLAGQSVQFRNMVTEVAYETLQDHCNVSVDTANLKFPKMKYKGVRRPIIVRKRTHEVNMHDSHGTGVEQVIQQFYMQMDKQYASSKSSIKKSQSKSLMLQKKSEYTAPIYVIKHCKGLDIQDFRNDSNSKLNATIPNELIVEIDLPLLKCSADLNLNVTEKSVNLVSEKPAKYKLDVMLPYSIEEDFGNAKFDVDTRKLTLTLSVKQSNHCLNDVARYDSGVESDHSPMEGSPVIKELELPLPSPVLTSEIFGTSEPIVSSFLNPDLYYILPDYTCHLFDNIISFTLHVKNVDSNSIAKQYNESSSAIYLKFSSISASYFPTYYAIFMKLPDPYSIDQDRVSLEAWDNNVIVQIPYKPHDQILNTYYIGTSENTIEEKLVDEPSIIHNKRSEQLENQSESEIESTEVNVHSKSDDELTIVLNPKAEITEQNFDSDEELLTAINSEEDLNSEYFTEKTRNLSESSVDECSFTQSPVKSKSILKTSRSISESSVDDCALSSVEDSFTPTLESYNSEDPEASSSMKKTVRFNDVVSKQVFRSNSSILGQRKKNQRKSRNKKRAQERRLSESENSEGEDRKDKEKKVLQQQTSKVQINKGCSKTESKCQIDFKSDLIFDLDM